MDERVNTLAVDLSAILTRLGGDATFAIECTELLEADLPAMLYALNQGFRLGSAEAIHRGAHTLKGVLSNFCETGPTLTAARIDILVLGGRIDDARPLMAVLEEEVASLVTLLHGLRSWPTS